MQPSENRIVRYGKECAKEWINRYLNIHRKGDLNDILIVSSPRSGSTWLLNIIASQPGLKAINEPLNNYILNYNRYLLSIVRKKYISLQSEEEKLLHHYFNGQYPIAHFGITNIFSSQFHFFTNRRVIKTIWATPLLEFFSNWREYDLIYLIRHPISQSLSCIKRGHLPQIKLYLEDAFFLEKHLDNKMITIMEEIDKKGTLLEKFVLEWCLDNIIPLKMIKQNILKGIFVAYEELVVQNQRMIHWLAQTLKLTAEEKMIRQINVPSKVSNTSLPEVRKSIKKGDIQKIIGSWQKKLENKERISLTKILETFEIDCYNVNKLLPNNFLLHFIKNAFIGEE